MRSHHQAAAVLLQAFEISKCAHILRAAREIEQQNVLALDGPFDARNQHQPSLGGVRAEVRDVQLLVVQRDSERVVTQRRRVVYQLGRRIRNGIVGVVSRVGMQLDFEHRRLRPSVFMPGSIRRLHDRGEPSPFYNIGSTSDIV